MSTPQQYAIREVGLCTFYDLATNKALVQLQNLQSTEIENTATIVYARGNLIAV